jgi:hypothetical protein
MDASFLLTAIFKADASLPRTKPQHGKHIGEGEYFT